MNGILLINKEMGVTSRDVVNQISKKLKTKKVGHAGTLDPIATGLLVVGVGKGTKVLDLLTLDKKEYIAEVKMGIETDTLDITGTKVLEKRDFLISKEKLIEVLNSYKKSYYQTVPKYSAVKIKGKKLYEYARCNKEIELPKRLVDIYDISLLNYDSLNGKFTFKVLVSKGTYIRSLIKDIGKSLDVPCTMNSLIRTKSGKFQLENSLKIEDNLENMISLKDALDFKTIEIMDSCLLKKVENGNQVVLDNVNDLYIIFLHHGIDLAIYKKENFNIYKAFKVF